MINNVATGATLHFSSDNGLDLPTGSDKGATEVIDATALLDKLAELEGKLEVLAKTVNEEIQIFIASVSVRDSEVMLADSKVMRDDSQIMKQQAARTTLLTTLAVIYLPLQLITGIFGMNIKEITGDGRPKWWACLIALGVAGVSTFIIYLAVKWWQRRSSQKKMREGEKDKEA